jgi:hypothetical protein
MQSNAQRHRRLPRRGGRPRRAGRESRAEVGGNLLLALRTGGRLGRPEIVTHVVVGEHLVADSEVALVPDLLVEPPDERLVVSRGHGTNMVGSPAGVTVSTNSEGPGTVERARRDLRDTCLVERGRSRCRAAAPSRGCERLRARPRDARPGRHAVVSLGRDSSPLSERSERVRPPIRAGTPERNH